MKQRKRMRRIRVAAVLTAALLLPIFFSGCWDYREIEGLTLVDGIAVDRGQNGYKYHLTFECIRMTGDQKGVGIEPWVLETDGDTIFEAARGALKISEKRLYFNPARVVVFSEDIAKEGIRPVLDWFLRDAEPRITLEFVVSREKTASEILKQEPQPGQLNSYLISNFLGGAASYSGDVADQNLYEIDNILNSEGTSLVLPGVAASKNLADSKLKLSGTAVFKGDKLAGWLDDDHTKYLNFILNHIKGGLIVTSDGPQDEKMAIEILSSSTKIKSTVENGSVTMKINVDVSGALGEKESKTDLPGKETIRKAEEDAAKTLKNGIYSTISQVQQKYNSDIFGFGSKVYKTDPEEWKKLKPEWNEKFQNLKCEADVKVKIQNTALVFDAKDGD